MKLKSPATGRWIVTHGQRDPHRTTGCYRSWMAMKSRCLRPKHPHYEKYGGRGITICERWMTFENFYADMGERPEKRTLDRINNDGNYEPENCRWSTFKEQGNNRNNNRFLTFNGEVKSLREWAQLAEIKPNTLRMRIVSSGMTVAQALMLPFNKHAQKTFEGSRPQEHISRNVVIEFNGERLTGSAWARKLGINPSTIFARIERGEVLPEKILATRRLPKGSSCA